MMIGDVPRHVVVIGAGPAGLTAAHELTEAGIAVTILERGKDLGGLGGTTSFEGLHGTYRFDFGGHRFITHNADLLRLVEELVGDDLLTATRHSVIRFGGRTYDYPLSLKNLLKTAPPGLIAGASLDLARLALGRRAPSDDSFAAWIESRFGRTLYRTFFEGYTAKLWGIDPRQLSADWAEQRISLVDLKEVARRLLPGAGQGPRTYARGYRYPRHGFGMIFQRLAERVIRQGAVVRTGVTVNGLATGGGRVRAVLTDKGPLTCDAVISSVPLPDMVAMTGGASSLKFRGLRFFNMVMATPDVSPFTWQYLSDPDMLATRLQEPRRRSPQMSPPGMTSLMLEIPCDPGDALWTVADDVLFERACGDLRRLGIDASKATGEYFSARTPYAYPVMDLAYRAERRRAFDHLRQFENLIQCGRQGTFRYVFTDAAMETGQMAARGILSRSDVREAIYEHRNERTVIETESIA
ncbi:FAD-dependent oxidoreductase [Aurantimonas sp. VKM B-3413]|uniref:FAD-dependent oxidoreductase n=1 Tax=Aurantimonas sp. VKM B-3413 TaxID=2779401 RepID=UPI001E4AFDC8|nr:FAD-dependent oxidoreductase [Aurantimonas sp. VKM B-3413]MCB8838183.1 FAD-dependent oxidoreductase [Aurantimonas sp. VKM B-3413]